MLGNQVYIDRTQRPPTLVNRIIRLAAFQNPEFYAAQAIRLPNLGKPRMISIPRFQESDHMYDVQCFAISRITLDQQRGISRFAGASVNGCLF